MYEALLIKKQNPTFNKQKYANRAYVSLSMYVNFFLVCSTVIFTVRAY